MDKEETVLSFLEDEQSKFIYKKRLEYNKTKDYRFIQEMVETSLPQFKGKSFYWGKEEKLIEILRRKKNIVVFGSGIRGKRLLTQLMEASISVNKVVDNNVNLWGKYIKGIVISSPSEIDYSQVDCVIVTPGNYKIVSAICKQLEKLGVSKSVIVDYREFTITDLLEEQYFDEEIVKLQEKEVFVDAGVLDLGTSVQFIRNIQRKGIEGYKILAFEPDIKAYKSCKSYLEENPDLNIQLYNVGLWENSTVIGFVSGTIGDSRVVSECAESTIEVVALDQFLSEEISYIKMDIEGAELEALMGAKEIIKKYKPKLAISIYHKPEDIVEIPLYIKELVPEYKLYIRHYSNYQCETILYAVVD